MYNSELQRLGLNGYKYDEEIIISELPEIRITIKKILTDPQNASRILNSKPHVLNYLHNEGGEIPISFNLFDPSASEVVVSPAYALKNGIEPISKDRLYSKNDNGFNNYFNKNGAFLGDKFASENPSNFIKVDEIIFAVVGVGTSPDFAYPIIDNSNLSVDTKNQGIIFTNSSGYSRVISAFGQNQMENYLAGRFVENTSKKDREDFIRIANQLAISHMG
ncbi:unnamed protein product [Didymodactylos carnosus]|uniref:Uncharacterized protein n=1 Tax=Didymodactylos carnosus TaxID=1234261 RepID=A0A8S2GZV8_9BILA|nr:unnamed protein product [Didymodactylos carnosus]CAF3581041.1 unnamed protein product [Didymodactylos carnosus]